MPKAGREVVAGLDAVIVGGGERWAIVIGAIGGLAVRQARNPAHDYDAVQTTCSGLRISLYSPSYCK